jgi:hypothetical protein
VAVAVGVDVKVAVEVEVGSLVDVAVDVGVFDGSVVDVRVGIGIDVDVVSTVTGREVGPVVGTKPVLVGTIVGVGTGGSRFKNRDAIANNPSVTRTSATIASIAMITGGPSFGEFRISVVS